MNSYNESMLSSNDNRRRVTTGIGNERGDYYSGQDTLNSFLYENNENDQALSNTH